jgi:hypothetical protein
MTLWDEMKVDLEKAVSKTHLLLLGALATGLLVAGSCLGTIADDARTAFWHTLAADNAVRTFWPTGALFTLLMLLMSAYAAIVQLIGAAVGGTFLYRLWKRWK